MSKQSLKRAFLRIQDTPATLATQVCLISGELETRHADARSATVKLSVPRFGVRTLLVTGIVEPAQ